MTYVPPTKLEMVLIITLALILVAVACGLNAAMTSTRAALPATGAAEGAVPDVVVTVAARPGLGQLVAPARPQPIDPQAVPAHTGPLLAQPVR